MHNRHLYIGKIRELKEAQSQKELDEAFAPFKENEEFWKKEFETEGIDFDRFKKNDKAEKKVTKSASSKANHYTNEKRRRRRRKRRRS